MSRPARAAALLLGLLACRSVDLDGDGYADTASGGDDCDDDSALVHPGAIELCNEIDDDCDGVVDEASGADGDRWYQDADGDGYGDVDSWTRACSQPEGFTDDDTDCDDDDASVHPDQADVAGNGVDDDCDGVVDEATHELAGLAEVLAPSVVAGAFGASVAVADLDQDGQDDLLVGAPEDNGIGSAWLLTAGAELELSGQQDEDAAGSAVAATDLDGDGLAELAVGAPLNLGTGIDSGVVYLLAGPITADAGLNSRWMGKLLGQDPHDHLGSSLAAADGLLAVAATSFDFDGDGARAGAVYVIDQLPEDAVDIDEVAVAQIQGVDGGTELGAGLAWGELSGDGVKDLVVGGPGAGEGGRAWLWLGPISGVSSVEEGAAAWSEEVGDELGAAVAVVGDLDGDGLDEVAVGAPGQDVAGTDAGAVVILGGGDWTVRSTLLGGVAGDRAGSALSGGQDLDGDGVPDLVVAAEGAGAAHVLTELPAGTQSLDTAPLTLLADPGAPLQPLLDPTGPLLLGDPQAERVWRLDPGELLP